VLAATAAGAALGTAVTLHVAREERARDFNRACFPFKLHGCAELKSRVTATQTAAVATYAGAAVLAALSTYLYITAGEPPPTAAKPPLALAGCTPTVVGLSCAARF
jgi:hypothetical protein